MYDMIQYRYNICIFHISDSINIMDIIVPLILKSGYTVSITIQKTAHYSKIYLINNTNQTVPTRGSAKTNPRGQHDWMLWSLYIFLHKCIHVCIFSQNTLKFLKAEFRNPRNNEKKLKSLNCSITWFSVHLHGMSLEVYVRKTTQWRSSFQMLTTDKFDESVSSDKIINKIWETNTLM